MNSSPCCSWYPVVLLSTSIDLHRSDDDAHCDVQAPRPLLGALHAVQGGDHDPDPEANLADLSVLHQAPGRRVLADIFEKDALKVRFTAAIRQLSGGMRG
jgi:hypothetical protein